eukprot:3275102-Rhodomonas_salina.2
MALHTCGTELGYGGVRRGTKLGYGATLALRAARQDVHCAGACGAPREEASRRQLKPAGFLVHFPRP